MSDWSYDPANDLYTCIGKRVCGFVSRDGAYYKGMVTIDNVRVSQVEDDGREDALSRTKSQMSYACHLRRFEKNPPEMPGDPDDDDDDDDD